MVTNTCRDGPNTVVHARAVLGDDMTMVIERANLGDAMTCLQEHGCYEDEHVRPRRWRVCSGALALASSCLGHGACGPPQQARGCAYNQNGQVNHSFRAICTLTAMSMQTKKEMQNEQHFPGNKSEISRDNTLKSVALVIFDASSRLVWCGEADQQRWMRCEASHVSLHVYVEAFHARTDLDLAPKVHVSKANHTFRDPSEQKILICIFRDAHAVRVSLYQILTQGNVKNSSFSLFCAHGRMLSTCAAFAASSCTAFGALLSRM
jgi:hypothetical protein